MVLEVGMFWKVKGKSTVTCLIVLSIVLVLLLKSNCIYNSNNTHLKVIDLGVLVK